MSREKRKSSEVEIEVKWSEIENPENVQEFLGGSGVLKL
jgi:hypothetical protein